MIAHLINFNFRNHKIITLITNCRLIDCLNIDINFIKKSRLIITNHIHKNIITNNEILQSHQIPFLNIQQTHHSAKSQILQKLTSPTTFTQLC